MYWISDILSSYIKIMFIGLITQLKNGNVIDLFFVTLNNKSQTGLSPGTSWCYCSDDHLSLQLVESNCSNFADEILAKLLQFNWNQVHMIFTWSQGHPWQLVGMMQSFWAKLYIRARKRSPTLDVHVNYCPKIVLPKNKSSSRLAAPGSPRMTQGPNKIWATAWFLDKQL